MIERPDLRQVSADVVAYIEFLEKALLGKGSKTSKADVEETEELSDLEPSEPPTTLQVITTTQAGIAKRTPRHLYQRQRRGGMGVFDLQTGEEDPPAMVVIADEADRLLLFTNQGRVFRSTVGKVPASTDIRAKGQSIVEGLPLRPGEQLVSILPEASSGYYLLASQRGWVRRISYSYMGKNMIDGTTFHNVNEGGYLAHVCWSAGQGDVVLVTRLGLGIRFSESQLPARGCLGLRVEPEDQLVGIAAVREEGILFLLSNDGKGTIRLMSGFKENKAPGAGGKVIMKTDNLVGIASLQEGDDLFLLSRLGKMIRFKAEEVPAKEGVVQGVHCFNLRSDLATALVRAGAI